MNRLISHLIAYLFSYLASLTVTDEVAKSLLEAVATARESDLSHFESRIAVSSKLFDEEKTKFNGGRAQGEFLSVVKRDFGREWLGEYRDGKLSAAYTLLDGRGFFFAGYVRDHFGSIHYSGDTDGSLLVQVIDPLMLGISNRRDRQKSNAIRESWRLDYFTADKFTSRDKIVVGQGNAQTVLISVNSDLVIEIEIDTQFLRVLEIRLIHSKYNEPVKGVITSTYSDRIPVPTIPAKVVYREWVGDTVTYESIAEVKEFKLRPKFEDNEFGLGSVGMPPGTRYLDQALDKFQVWSGSGAISPQLASLPPISKELIARKNAEEAAKNRWRRHWLIYLFGSAGILITAFILYRKWRFAKS